VTRGFAAEAGLKEIKMIAHSQTNRWAHSLEGRITI